MYPFGKEVVASYSQSLPSDEPSPFTIAGDKAAPATPDSDSFSHTRGQMCRFQGAEVIQLCITAQLMFLSGQSLIETSEP